MVMVVDKKIVKHLVRAGDGLLEIPVRISFEYEIQSARFVDGSMARDYIYNRGAVLKHFPRIDKDELERGIEDVVDRSLEEHLRYCRQAAGAIRLYPGGGSGHDGGDGRKQTNEQGGDDGLDDSDSPGIILP